jgi:hypothetical protein
MFSGSWKRKFRTIGRDREKEYCKAQFNLTLRSADPRDA